MTEQSETEQLFPAALSKEAAQSMANPGAPMFIGQRLALTLLAQDSEFLLTRWALDEHADQAPRMFRDVAETVE